MGLQRPEVTGVLPLARQTMLEDIIMQRPEVTGVLPGLAHQTMLEDIIAARGLGRSS